MNLLFEVTDEEGRKLRCAGVALACAAGLAVIAAGAVIYAACERWPSLIKGLIVIGAALIFAPAAALALRKRKK